MTEPNLNTDAPSPWKRIFFAMMVVAVVVASIVFRESFSLKNLAMHETALRELKQQNPVMVFGLVFVIYVAVTGLSLPGALAMSLLIGWFFRFWQGTLLVSFASTTGATLAFLMSRYFLRDWVHQRFKSTYKQINESLDREGIFYLLTLRLIPYVPFVLINLVMGLTNMRARTFWWVSQIGMLPGTCVFLYAGASVPDLNTLVEQGAGGILTINLIVAFALLGVFPLLVRKIVEKIRATPAE